MTVPKDTRLRVANDEDTMDHSHQQPHQATEPATARAASNVVFLTKDIVLFANHLFAEAGRGVGDGLRSAWEVAMPQPDWLNALFLSGGNGAMCLIRHLARSGRPPP
jgi:hypothetical protein